MTDTPTGDPAGPRTEGPSNPPAEGGHGSAAHARSADGSRQAASGPDPEGDGPAKRRRRGSSGGLNRSRPLPEGAQGTATNVQSAVTTDRNPELPDTPREGRPKTMEAADASLVRRPAAEAARKPQIGDTMPAPATPA